jgi:hypothetical protein
MRRQVQLLRQLVLDSQYVVDEAILADAIIARARARRLAGVAFRNDTRGPQVRSFRPSRQARSFRPCGVAVSSNGGGVLATGRRIAAL